MRTTLTLLFVLRALVLVGPEPANAQSLATSSDRIPFEVVSIKESVSGPNLPVVDALPGGRIRISGVTLRDLIRLAYRPASGQVLVQGGPAWLSTAARFDVTAIAPGGTRPTTGMLQRLLDDRFRLRTHVEPRQHTVFDLVMARADGRLGPGLSPTTCVTTNDCVALRIGAGLSIIGRGVSIVDLAAALSNFPVIDAPVRDRTGLAGAFDVQLRFRGANDPDPDHGPLLPTALEEQLGLKLQRATGTVDVIVVDSAERPDAD